MERKTKYFLAVILYVLFLVLIVLLRTVDVAPIGPEDTEVGLAKLNVAVVKATGVGGSAGSGVRMSWYKLTEYLGYLSILAACVFALIGAVQLFQRKSLRKVDREILALGGAFIAAIVIYVFFEKVVINCRPVILPDETGPEASFPSSHTVLVCVIMGGILMILEKYVKLPWLCALLRLAALAIILIMVFGRLYCGCHWFTDILGGVLVSGALLALCSAVIDRGEARADGA